MALLGRRVAFGVLTSALLVAGAVAQALPAHAEAGPYSGWTHREDARSPDTTETESRPGSGLQMYSFDNEVSIASDATGDDTDLGGIEFLPPEGQTLQPGVTYPVGGPFREPTSTRGQVITYRNGTMCGRDPNGLTSGDSLHATPAVGWFHVGDIEYVDGVAVSFAATYEISCQYLDGPAGFEGSIAVNAPLPPAAVPDAPVAPGPITDLRARNTDPDGAGTNTTTLSWTSPEDYGDIHVDLVQSIHRSLFSALVSDTNQVWRGRANGYAVGDVDFMDGRTYRVVTRGPTGRLGTPTLLTVLGSRLEIPVENRTIAIGQPVPFSGHLHRSDGVDEPGDGMSGPPLPGRTVVMCEQPTAHFVSGGCDLVDSTTTATDGGFTLAATPVSNSYYSVMLPSSPDLVGNRSFVLFTGVTPQTDLRAPAGQALGSGAHSGSRVSTRASARGGVRRGSVIHFTTSRARRGSLGLVRLQHLGGGRWHTVVTRRLPRGTGRLGLPFRERTRGLHSFRVLKPADAHHVNGLSRIVKVRVR